MRNHIFYCSNIISYQFLCYRRKLPTLLANSALTKSLSGFPRQVWRLEVKWQVEWKKITSILVCQANKKETSTRFIPPWVIHLAFISSVPRIFVNHGRYYSLGRHEIKAVSSKDGRGLWDEKRFRELSVLCVDIDSRRTTTKSRSESSTTDGAQGFCVVFLFFLSLFTNYVMH